MIELIKVLQLLRNFLHCNASVKVSISHIILTVNRLHLSVLCYRRFILITKYMSGAFTFK